MKPLPFQTPLVIVAVAFALAASALAQTLTAPEIAVEVAEQEVGVSSDGFLTLTYFQDKTSTGLLYYLQASPSLLSWTTPNATTTSTEDAGDFWRITLRDTLPMSEADRRFLRLKIMESTGLTTLLFPPTSLWGSWNWDGKILRASLAWSDNSPIETAYAIERDLGPGFQSIATTAPDTAHYLDPRAASPNSTATYRVRALAPGEASAYTNELTLTTPLDTDLDGIPDQYELGDAYIGDYGTYATSAFNFSSGSSGISDGWLIRYGLDPFNADPNAMMPGGMTLQEKNDEGLDPTVEDTDLDGVIDSEDAVAYEPLFTHSRLPLASYAIIGLGEVEQEGEPVLLSDNGLVILRKESENADTTYRFWKAGTGGEIAIPEEMRATWSDIYSQTGFFGINASDVATGTVAAQDYSEEPPFSFPGWGWAAFTWTIEEGFRLLPLPQDKPGWPGEFLVYSIQSAFRIDDSGVVRGESYYQYQAPPPPDAWPSTIWDINYQGAVQWAVGGATFIDSPDIDPTLQGMEYIPGVHRGAIARSGGGIEAWVDGIYTTTTSHIENFALGPVGENWVGSINDLPKPFAVGEHLTPNPLGAYPAMSAWVRQNQQWSRVDLLAEPPALDGSTVRLEAEDQVLTIATHLNFSPERPSGPVLTNDLGQVVLAWSRLEGSPGGWENARSHLWQNGRAHEISTLLPDGWKDVEVTGLNDSGAMIAVANKTIDAQGQPIPEADQEKHGLFLLPFGFLTWDRDTRRAEQAAITDSESVPIPEVTLTITDVTMLADGSLRFNVSGTVKDELSEYVAASSERVQELRFKVNGEVVEKIDNLPAQAVGEPEAPWQQALFEIPFQRIITIPDPGAATVTLTAETSANAAGNVGWASVAATVGWEDTDYDDPPDFDSGNSAGLHIAFPSAPDPASLDSASIYIGDRGPNATDGLMEEQDIESNVWSGSIIDGGQAQTCNLTTELPIDLDPSEIDGFAGSVTYGSATFDGFWYETSENSRVFVLDQVAPPATPDKKLVFDAKQVEQSRLGWVQPYIWRASIPAEWETPGNFHVELNSTQKQVKPFTFSPRFHYVVDSTQTGRPQIFIVSADGDDLPGYLQPSNFTLERNGDDLEFGISLNGNRHPTAKVTIFDAGIETPSERPTRQITPLNEEMLLGFFTLLYQRIPGENTGQPADINFGQTLLAWYLEAGNVIVIEDGVDSSLNPFDGPYEVERLDELEMKIRIRLDRGLSPVDGAMALWQALKEALPLHPFRGKIQDEVLEPDNAWTQAIGWRGLQAAMNEAMQQAMTKAAFAAEMYVEVIAITNVGADVVLTVNDAVEGRPTAAVLGALPFVTAGTAIIIKNTAGEVLVEITEAAADLLRKADGLPKQANRALKSRMDVMFFLRAGVQAGTINPVAMEALIKKGWIPVSNNKAERGFARRQRMAAEAPPTGMRNPECQHDLPLERKEFFLSRGMDPNDPEFTRWLDQPEHRRIHNTDLFNIEWIDWIDLHLDATYDELYEKFLQMRNAHN